MGVAAIVGLADLLLFSAYPAMGRLAKALGICAVLFAMVLGGMHLQNALAGDDNSPSHEIIQDLLRQSGLIKRDLQGMAADTSLSAEHKGAIARMQAANSAIHTGLTTLASRTAIGEQPAPSPGDFAKPPEAFGFWRWVGYYRFQGDVRFHFENEVPSYEVHNTGEREERFKGCLINGSPDKRILELADLVTSKTDESKYQLIPYAGPQCSNGHAAWPYLFHIDWKQRPDGTREILGEQMGKEPSPPPPTPAPAPPVATPAPPPPAPSATPTPPEPTPRATPIPVRDVKIWVRKDISHRYYTSGFREHVSIAYTVSGAYLGAYKSTHYGNGENCVDLRHHLGIYTDNGLRLVTYIDVNKLKDRDHEITFYQEHDCSSPPVSHFKLTTTLAEVEREVGLP